MSNYEKQYLDLLQTLLNEGKTKTDRTGTGTLSMFGQTMRINLQDGFPLLTTKKVHFKSVVGELLWFISGCRGGIKGLREDYGVTIWDEWESDMHFHDKKVAYTNMVSWRGSDVYINQLKDVITQIKTNPDSRRLLVLNWNPRDIAMQNVVLPACHYAFQFYVQDGKLSCMFQMRSVDTLLGCPFNIASYALLTHMVAQVCNLEVGDLVWVGADVHLYTNHIEQAKLQISRAEKATDLPKIELNKDVTNIFNFKKEDIKLIGYNPQPAIKAPVAV